MLFAHCVSTNSVENTSEVSQTLCDSEALNAVASYRSPPRTAGGISQCMVIHYTNTCSMLILIKYLIHPAETSVNNSVHNLSH